MYIILEKFGGVEMAHIVTDEVGNNKWFDTFEEAWEEAQDCQDPQIIEIK